jgi:hypothetical protein
MIEVKKEKKSGVEAEKQQGGAARRLGRRLDEKTKKNAGAACQRCIAPSGAMEALF